ncbi:RodZ domain-containing protein [Anaerovibrio sp.]|uniref:helix-turn-helix domain-containing protein n=1 Tax=Anaerovibrio sp. TaxID=1872532 RepID=UPI003F159613
MVGEILRREREKQGLSIADVASETSIRDVYLKAIEKGSYDELPGDVYAKGFIRNYSRFLQIDGDSLLEQYDAERNIVKVVQPADMPAESDGKGSKKTFFGRREKKGKDTPVNAGSSAGYTGTKSGTNLFAAGDEYRHSLEREEKSGSKKFLILLGVMAVFLGGVYVAFMDEGTDPAAVSKPAVKQEETMKREAVAPVKYDGVEITAKMLENCWISVKVDGQAAFEGTVEKGKDMSWKGKERVEIRAGNAGGIQITFNGQDVGTLGELGQIADREFVKADEGKADAGSNSSGNADASAPRQTAGGESAVYAEEQGSQESYREPVQAEAPVEAGAQQEQQADSAAPAVSAAESGQPAAPQG